MNQADWESVEQLVGERLKEIEERVTKEQSFRSWMRRLLWLVHDKPVSTPMQRRLATWWMLLLRARAQVRFAKRTVAEREVIEDAQLTLMVDKLRGPVGKKHYTGVPTFKSNMPAKPRSLHSACSDLVRFITGETVEDAAHEKRPTFPKPLK